MYVCEVMQYVSNMCLPLHPCYDIHHRNFKALCLSLSFSLLIKISVKKVTLDLLFRITRILECYAFQSACRSERWIYKPL